MRRVIQALLFLVLIPCFILGQGKFKVSGKVTDAAGEPLIGASVMIRALNTGNASDFDGNYSFEIPNEYAKNQRVELTASMVNYKKKTFTVILNGSDIKQDFILEEDVFQNEEIVVTGIASRTSKSVADVAVARIKAEELTAIQPYQAFSQLLSGKVAGVQMQQASGNVGGGFRFFVRGGGGLNGNQQPLIFMDGVKLSDRSVIGFAAGGQDMNVLANLNPNDIESIEFLKGPAAASTYGTSASNGVVVIKTKQGKLGPGTGSGSSMIFNVRHSRGWNEQSYKYKDDIWVNADEINSLFNKGAIDETNLNISGGNSFVRYFASYLNRKEDGLFNNDAMNKNSVRANFTAYPSENLSLTVSTTYTDNVIKRGDGDNSLLSYLEQTLTYSPAYPDVSRAAIDAMRDINKNNQFIGSFQLSYKPIADFEINANLGVDQTDWAQEKSRPFGFKYISETVGRRALFNFNDRRISADINARYTYNIMEDLTATSIIGVQTVESKYKSTAVQYKGFVTSKLDDIGAASELVSKGETAAHTREAGIFTENQFNYMNTYMVSFALRKDYASSVGSEAPSILYPKVSGAVRIDKFDILPSFVNLFKFRFAYGENGQLPTATDPIAFLWGGATGAGGAVAVVNSIGNPSIEPERIKEFELGFDAELFNQFNIEFTYYNQTAENSIIRKVLSPSSGLGFFTSPFNIGAVKVNGFEAMLQYTPIKSPDYDLNLSLIWNYQDNEVTSLGGTADIYDGSNINVIKEGYAKHEFFLQPVNGARFDATTGKYLGPDVGTTRISFGNPIPNNTGSFTLNFRFLKDFNLYAFSEWALGNEIYGGTTKYFHTDGGSTVYNALADKLASQTIGSAEYKETATKMAKMDYRYNSNFIYDGSYFILREVSLSYNATDLMKEFTSNSIFKNFMVGLSVRNVFISTKYEFGDPQINSTGGRGLSRGQDFYTLQTPRTYNFWIALGL